MTYSLEDPEKRLARIQKMIDDANREGRILEPSGTSDEVSAAIRQGLQRMTPEQKKKLREGIFAKVYDEKKEQPG